MADRLGMSSGGYKKLEYATRELSVSKAKAIAEKLGRPVSDVIGEGAIDETDRSSVQEPANTPDDPRQRRTPSRSELADAIARFLEWDEANQAHFLEALSAARHMGSIAPESEQALRAAILKVQKE